MAHGLLSGGRPTPTATLLVSRSERFPSQSGMRAVGSLESGGRMWEISWNVQGFFMLVFFPSPPPHTAATTVLVVFVPSTFRRCRGSLSRRYSTGRRAQQRNPIIPGPRKRSAPAPKCNYVIRDERSCLVWPVFCCNI